MWGNAGLRTAVRVVVAVLMTLLVGACAQSEQGDSPAVDPAAPAVGGGSVGMPEQGGDGEEDTGDGDEGRLMIRSKVLRLEVDSTPDAVTKIRDLARSHGGTVTDMQVATDTDEWLYRYGEDGAPSGDGTALRGWVTTRVPADTYEEYLGEVAALGVVKFQSEAVSDVTQEHVDLSARLENMRAQEARLREFFDAAKTVEDMLSIEKELTRVRGEIEAMDAQVTYLERQAAMATVTIELVEPRSVVTPAGESWGFREAITDGIRGAAGLLTGLLTLLIATAPVWVTALVLFFPIRAWLRRRAGRRAAPVGEPIPPAEEHMA
ncbi:hypothetical protein GCM10025789_15590 [Tessaracoccus lubricantis]|uniref:DUF4349 domain-containing protein n=1 Tax=Tessaracoccus lubricantis TaxID=545543 RepID=A0ABP9FF00_9ACTN